MQQDFVVRSMNFLSRRWLTLATIALVLMAFYALSQFSFITISIPNSADKDTSIVLSKNGAVVEEYITTANSVRKFVQRGQYEVSVQQNETSYFTSVSAGGFLTTKRLSATLSPEKARAFVGNNPSPCMEFTDERLFSYACQSSATNLNIHQPATKNTATTISRPSAGADFGSLELVGSADTKFGTLLLQRDRTGGAGYTLARLDKKYTFGSVVASLSSASANNSYKITPYSEGFLLYSTRSGHYLYYKDLDGVSEQINVPSPKTEGSQPYILAARGSKIAVASAVTDESGTVNLDDTEQKQPSSEIVILENGKVQKIFSLPGLFSDFLLCGDNIICANSNRTLRVYDISAGKPKKITSLVNTEGIAMMGQTPLIATNKGIVGYKADFSEGYYYYSYGSYRYCGLDASESEFVVCVINPQNQKVALRVTGQTNTDSIDKKILGLSSVPGVSSVSIYGQQVFVVPNYGTPTYNKRTGFYDYYSPEVTNDAKNRITAKLNELGLSSSYKITVLKQ